MVFRADCKNCPSTTTTTEEAMKILTAASDEQKAACTAFCAEPTAAPTAFDCADICRVSVWVHVKENFAADVFRDVALFGMVGRIDRHPASDIFRATSSAPETSERGRHLMFYEQVLPSVAETAEAGVEYWL